MSDITMCINNSCKDKEECLRYTKTPSEHNKSYSYFICDNKEFWFISNKENKEVI